MCGLHPLSRLRIWLSCCFKAYCIWLSSSEQNNFLFGKVNAEILRVPDRTHFQRSSFFHAYMTKGSLCTKTFVSLKKYLFVRMRWLQRVQCAALKPPTISAQQETKATFRDGLNPGFTSPCWFITNQAISFQVYKGRSCLLMTFAVSLPSCTFSMKDPTAMSLGNPDSWPHLPLLSQTRPSWESTKSLQASNTHWLLQEYVALFLRRFKTLCGSTWNMAR